jgi:hypothetical protein
MAIPARRGQQRRRQQQCGIQFEQATAFGEKQAKAWRTKATAWMKFTESRWHQSLHQSATSSCPRFLLTGNPASPPDADLQVSRENSGMSSVMRTAPPGTRTNPSSSEFAALHHKDQPRDAAKPTTWHTGHPYAGLRL